MSFPSRFRLVLLSACLAAPVFGQAQTISAPELPLVLIDADFNADTVGRPPQGPTKEVLEKRTASFWGQFPHKTYAGLTYVTPTRVATVEASAFGLEDQPLVFSYDEAAHPQYGPQVVFPIPAEVNKIAKQYRLTFDLSKGDTAQAGGFTIGDIATLSFNEMGGLLANRTEIYRYEARQPLHFDVLIDVPAKTATFTINGDKDHAATIPWARPTGTLHSLRLEGLLPGGFGRAPGKLAFDNIKLVLEETL